MHFRLLAFLLTATLATAGCFGADDSSGEPPADTASPDNSTAETGDGRGNMTADNQTAPPPDDSLVAQGPSWAVGDAWTMTVAWSDDRDTSTWEMVTFLADGEHYWLGTPDRAQSLDHVVTDTNPLIGRIHYSILSPHESGRHAGMYDFPLEDGKTWKGFFFGEEWTFKAHEADVQAGNGKERGFRITGTIPGNDAASLTADYVPSEKWFRNLDIRGAAGGDVTLTVTERATKDTGTYYFHRGPDVFDDTLQNTLAGRTEKTFTVEETEHLKVLLATVEGNATAPSTNLEFIGPDGTTAATRSGDNLTGRVLIEDPAPGEWTVRLTSVGGDASFHVKAWAVDEHVGEL